MRNIRKHWRLLIAGLVSLAVLLPGLAMAEGLVIENDNFANATEIATLPFSVVIDNTLATREIGETQECGGYRTVWYRYTPVADVAVHLSTSASPGRAAIGVFTLENDQLTRKLCHAPGYNSDLLLAGGTTYYIQLGHYYMYSTGNIGFSLSPTAAIAGKLVDDTGDPVSGGCITAYTPGGSRQRSARTASDGSYTLLGLTSQSYKIEFGCYFGGYVPEWYNDKPDLQSADAIEAISGSIVRGIDANLVRKGIVTGRVTLSSATKPLVCVTAYTPTGGAVMTVRADSSGLYSLYAKAGEYRVKGYDCNDILKPQWYSGKSTLESSDPVFVTTGTETTGIDFHLESYPAPANDDFANATEIASLPFNETANLRGASVEAGEITNCPYLGFVPQQTVWYKYKPANSELISASTSSGSPFLAVYLQPAAELGRAGLAEVGCSEHATGEAIRVEAGSTYYFQLGAGYRPGNASINVSVVEPPVNDKIAAAKVIGSLPYSDSVNTRAASTEVDEPTSCGRLENTVWYSFTADRDRVTRFSVSNGSTFSEIAVYEASSLGPIPVVDSCTPLRSVDVKMVSDKTYLVQVGTPPGFIPGTVTLNAIDVVAPANDYLANAEQLSSLPQTIQGETTFSTREPTERNPCGGTGGSVWYRFTPSTDMLTVTQVSGLDSKLALYQGSGWEDLRLIDCNYASAGVNPAQAFPLVAGQPYLIQILGTNTDGAFSLELMNAEQETSHTFATSAPCAALCPYWDPQLNDEQQYEASCAPSPKSPEGSWKDLIVTVPETVNGVAPRYLVFHLESGIDFDSFICRQSPQSGKYFVTHDANEPLDQCGTVSLGCEETAVTKVLPGETYVLRAYNWSDPGQAHGGYAFVGPG